MRTQPGRTLHRAIAVGVAATAAVLAIGCGGSDSSSSDADKAIRALATQAAQGEPGASDTTATVEQADTSGVITDDARACLEQTVGTILAPEESRPYLDDSDVYRDYLAKPLLNSDDENESWLVLTESTRVVGELYTYATEDEAAEHVPSNPPWVATRFGRTVAIFKQLVGGDSDDSTMFGGGNAEQRLAAASACLGG
jgi:hypothetical protein